MKKLLLICLFFVINSFPQGLSGNKTIGTGGDYATFQLAINALVNNGVGTGGVVFNVSPGIYTERISFTSFTGSSSNNRVVFQGSDSVVIKGIGTSATTDAMVTVTGCDYITFDGINIEDGGTSSADQVEIGYLITGTATKGSNFVVIRNCSVTMGGNAIYGSRYTRGIIIRSAATAVEGANNNNLISDVIINKVAWGIQVAGKATIAGVPTFPDYYNEIRYCTLGNNSWIGHNEASSAIGILLSSQKYAKVHDNKIDSVIVNTETAPVLVVSISGISVDNASGEIFNNKINNIKYYGPGGSSPNGIRISIIENDTMKIYNNFISNVFKSEFTPPSDNSVYAKGIWLFKQSGGGGTGLICYNSIVMEGETPISYSSAGFYLSRTSIGTSFVQLKNNIVINNFVPINFTPHQYGNSAYAIIDGNPDRGYLTSDHNLLFVADSNAVLGQIGRQLGTTVVNGPTLSEWQNISQGDSNSVSKIVTFVNVASGDLHLAGSSVGDFDLAAMPVSWIPFDIDNQPRDINLPYKGADEADDAIPVELITFIANVSNNNVVLHWSTASETNNLGFEVERSEKQEANSKEWCFVGFIEGNGTSTESRNYTFIENNIIPGSYSYRLKQIDFDGTYRYFDLANDVEVGLPEKFELLQNFPNPFNPSTVIKYTLPFESKVTIKIYNTLGKEIKLLKDEIISSGNYEVQFSSSNLSSGIYFYRLSVESVDGKQKYSSIKKMVLLK
jgi:hypothetical protein